MISQHYLRKFFGMATAFMILLSLLGFLATPSISHAAFPGTNGKIVFDGTQSGGVGQIYTMNPDGTGVTQLTFSSGGNGSAEWSADGTKIVFTSIRDGNPEIYIMNADGTGQTNLTNDPAIDDVPTFSPDGTKIAFTTQREGNEEIYIMNADGTGPINRTNNSAADAQPAWSPNGTKIAFESTRNGLAQIFVMNADGTNVTQLTTLFRNGGANWSPDGTKIAFHTDRDCGGCGTYFDIYSMYADGTGQTRRAFDPTYATGPAWSPDGTKIVFDSQRDGNYEVYIMNANGSGQTNRTNHPAVDFRANWGRVPDTTSPLVNISISAPDGQNGWFTTSPVIGSVAADDTTTGHSNITAISCTGATVGSITGLGTPSASASLTVSAEGVNNVSCTATDSANNDGAASGSSNTATVMIDSVGPNINIVSPVDGGSYLLNAAVASSFSCSDDTSGVDTCSGPVANGANFSTSPVGTHTFIVTATDIAGNSVQASNSYSVNYNFTGFFQPVDNLPTLNIVSAGRAIPVKFSLSGDKGLDIFTPGYPSSVVVACGTTAGDAIEQTVTAGSSSLSYDASTDQYTYVWKTDKAWAGTCRTLVVKLDDGTFHQANFKFK